MTKTKAISTIYREIAQINELIDWKVIKGLSYRREARRHRMLLHMLREMERSLNESKSLSFFH